MRKPSRWLFTVAGRLMTICAVVLAAVACQNTPVGPSSTLGAGAPVMDAATPATPAPAAETLRWDVVADGCAPRQPVPDLDGDAPDTQRIDGDRLEAVWYRPGERSIVAGFERDGEAWALCWWDTSGV